MSILRQTGMREDMKESQSSQTEGQHQASRTLGSPSAVLQSIFVIECTFTVDMEIQEPRTGTLDRHTEALQTNSDLVCLWAALKTGLNSLTRGRL